MKFLIIIKYVWGNVHEKVTQRNSEGVREKEKGERIMPFLFQSL